MRFTALNGSSKASKSSPARRQQRPRTPLRSTSSSRAVTASTSDYFANATDDGVLQLPLKQQLDEDQLTHVFGYDRDLQGKCVNITFTLSLAVESALGADSGLLPTSSLYI